MQHCHTPVPVRRCTSEDEDSKSYPGLPCLYKVHHVNASVTGLPAADFVTRERRGAGWLESHWAWADPASVQH